MTPEELDRWFSREQQGAIVSRLSRRMGITRTRAECFVRLWVYLLVKQYQQRHPTLKPPLGDLEFLDGAVMCTHREAAALFYGDKDQGSSRSAGMMLDKLVALGLIKKHFDGNTTLIDINPIPDVLNTPSTTPVVELKLDGFDPRCDAVPIAAMLATNYNWLNRNLDTAPHRISKRLRKWATEYAVGMRVLRRCDNLHPVGFYLLYPTTSQSEINFFAPPSKSLHLSSLSDVDPFVMANSGDLECMAVFIRSWIIDTPYLSTYCTQFVEDVQHTLIKMQRDFPSLCDLYTLVIHPRYQELAQTLGFHPTGKDPQLPISWMYMAIDRFLALDVQKVLQKWDAGNG